MQALSPPNIESELSYAYLHAVGRPRQAWRAALPSRHRGQQWRRRDIDRVGTLYQRRIPNRGGHQGAVKGDQSPLPADDGTNLSYFLKRGEPLQ